MDTGMWKTETEIFKENMDINGLGKTNRGSNFSGKIIEYEYIYE